MVAELEAGAVPETAPLPVALVPAGGKPARRPCVAGGRKPAPLPIGTAPMPPPMEETALAPAPLMTAPEEPELVPSPMRER